MHERGRYAAPALMSCLRKTQHDSQWLPARNILVDIACNYMPMWMHLNGAMESMHSKRSLSVQHLPVQRERERVM